MRIHTSNKFEAILEARRLLKQGIPFTLSVDHSDSILPVDEDHVEDAIISMAYKLQGKEHLLIRNTN